MIRLRPRRPTPKRADEPRGPVPAPPPVKGPMVAPVPERCADLGGCFGSPCLYCAGETT